MEGLSTKEPTRRRPRRSVRKTSHFSDKPDPALIAPEARLNREQVHSRGGVHLLFDRIKTVIKSPSETTVRRAKSRFRSLLESLRKRKTEWTVWKGTSRAQGRCAISHHSAL